MQSEKKGLDNNGKYSSSYSSTSFSKNFLNNQYIEFDGKQNKMFKGIFTIFGHGNVVGLGEALENDPGDLIVHQGRNEQGMAHAAMGYAKQKRRKQIYACTSSVGPGAANMVTAAATATANCIPVLFFTW